MSKTRQKVTYLEKKSTYSSHVSIISIPFVISKNNICVHVSYDVFLELSWSKPEFMIERATGDSALFISLRFLLVLAKWWIFFVRIRPFSNSTCHKKTRFLKQHSKNHNASKNGKSSTLAHHSAFEIVLKRCLRGHALERLSEYSLWKSQCSFSMKTYLVSWWRVFQDRWSPTVRAMR